MPSVESRLQKLASEAEVGEYELRELLRRQIAQRLRAELPKGKVSHGAVWSARHVLREGQDVTLGNWPFTLVGKRGKLVVRDRLETVDAGNGYHVSQGTWKVVRGTGQYAQVTGGGGFGGVWLESGPWSERRVGFLTVP